MDERRYWLAFSVFPGIGPIRFKTLLKNFDSAEDAWNGKPSDLEKILGKALLQKFEDFKRKFSIENYLKRLESQKVSFLILTDKEYPKLLKEIPNPPFVLYVKGIRDSVAVLENALRSPRQFDNSSKIPSVKNCLMPRFPAQLQVTRAGERQDPQEEKIIAVVGTRKITGYGREVTEFLTKELVNAGFTIVSGLAFGVDSVAHKTAVENNGKTIAVLGSGVDYCTPPANESLYNSIIKSGGCIFSEVPLGQIPSKGSFPSRNRIVAGLSLGVLVTEGAEDSGALITADYALKFGRKVFAVPGPITSNLSKGPYKLISKGAKLVTSVNDILEELSVKIKDQKSNIKKPKGETEQENKILELLQDEVLSFDQIVRLMKMDSSKTGSILSIMEIKGFIKSLGNGNFSIIN